MIHRPFSEIQEETLKCFPSLKSDKDGFVIYEVPFAGKKIQLTPEHLIGSYIYDRIEDIKAERHVDDLRLVLSVPSYFTEEQISRFQLGLNIAQINQYTLIHNIDSIALAYSYNNALQKEYSSPRTVLFVGMDFVAAEACVIRFSNDSYEILSYESSSSVGTQRINSLIFHEVEKGYKDIMDTQSGFEKLPFVYSKIAAKVTECRNQFSPSQSEFEAMIPDVLEEEEFPFVVEYASLSERIEEEGLSEAFCEMVKKCLEKAGNVKLDSVEPMNRNVFMTPFLTRLNELMKSSEQNISL